MIKPELTAATVVERDGRFLMVEETVDGRPVLNQPAGHVEPGETIVEAAVRETREETGWRITPEAVLGVYYWPRTSRGDCILRCAFSARAQTHDPAQALDNGIIAAYWLSRGELDSRRSQLRSPLVLATIDTWAAGVRQPLATIQQIGHE